MAETNPNKSNQYVMDPRQKLCWELYVNPKSETFGNGKQSAIKAGYEVVYADVITTRPWFEGKVRRLNLLNKGEKVLEEAIELDPLDENGKRDIGAWRIKLDASKFVAETQGKDEGYSKRSELTGKDGIPLQIEISKEGNNKYVSNPESITDPQ